MTVAIAIVFLPLSPSYDLDVFLRAGQAVLHSLQVYPSPGSPAVYSGSSFVYPYFTVFPFVALAAIGPSLAPMLFFALCVGAVLYATCTGSHADPWRASLILGTTFMITGLQLGALSPLLFAGSILLWRLRERPLALALIAGPLVASKLFLAPLLIWLPLACRYRALAWAGAATLLLLVASFALGPIGPTPYAHLLSQLGRHEARAGFGPIGALMNLGVSPAAAQASAVLLALAVLGAAYLYHRRTPAEGVLFGAAITASLVMTPVLWSHYLVLLPAVLLALDARRRWFVVLAAASWAIALPHNVRLDTDLIEGVSSSGTWVVVVISLAGLGYGARLTRGLRPPRGTPP
ncbi:MAG: hypothetical protein ACR2OB_02270 [Solirubrobacteraceae bacterium]